MATKLYDEHRWQPIIEARSDGYSIGISTELLATFYADWLGTYGFIQLWDHREENPKWVYMLVANTLESDWDTLRIVATWDFDNGCPWTEATQTMQNDLENL